MKRQREEETVEDRPEKRLRVPSLDRLSPLSDELLLRILCFVPVTTLNICQRVSQRLHAIAGDAQLWKAAYYNRFVRPRAARIPGTSSDQLSYSSKLSKWLDDANLVKRGQETNWKRQYKLRHNWSRGKCAVSEIPVAEEPPVPPLLVRMHNSIVFTADSKSGLRAWNTKEDRELIGCTTLKKDKTGSSPAPTSLAVDASDSPGEDPRVAVGFEDGSFCIYALQMDGSKQFKRLYAHPPPAPTRMVCAIAYTAPYLLSMDAGNLLSLYIFPTSDSQSELSPPELLYALRSYTIRIPLSLSIRTSSNSVTASIAYALSSYLSGWTVGIQEMRLSLSGELLESRVATAAEEHFHSISGSPPASSSYTHSTPPSPGLSNTYVPYGGPVYSKPTSLSYSHPYLLASHPDNTLTLYLVTSTSTSLSIGPGSRLWGHTSSVSGAHVGGRGKAVSVSRQGNELRVWELEGGLGSAAKRKRLLSGELSIQVRPEQSAAAVGLESLSEAISQRGSGLGLALEHGFDDTSVTRGWVGFDEENVVVLQEQSRGRQALVVYDFT